MILADGDGGWGWHDFELSDLIDIDTAGVVDGQVLKWIAVAGEWRPANDVGGATGADNWGTQVVLRDSSLLGDGTAGDHLGIDWDTLDAHINRYVVLNDLHNVDDTGVADGEVLAWVEAANEWRPLIIGPGGLGDNWGTQITETDSSLIGDGTAGNLLGVNWDTLQAYPDTLIVLDDLDDVDIDSLDEYSILGWDHEDSLWKPHYDDDWDMNNELIDSIVWEPIDSVDTMFSTLRIIEHSVDWNVGIPVDRDDITDNSVFELADIDTTGLTEGYLMRWTFIETLFVGDDTTLVYKWQPVDLGEMLDEHQIGDLGDVSDSVPITGDVMQWLGTEWGPGIDVEDIINVWQDHHGYIRPLTPGTADFRVYDFDSSCAVTLIETTGTASGTWYGLKVDRRGVAASDGFGIYGLAGTDGGISPGSEFYGVKGKASGGHTVYGLYGDGDYPGALGTGYGLYARGKTYGVYGYGTGTDGIGIYGKAADGLAGYFHGYVGINITDKEAIFDAYSDQDGNEIPSGRFSMHDAGFDNEIIFNEKWGGGIGSRALIHAKSNGNSVFIAKPDGNVEAPSGRIKDKTGFVMPVGSIMPYARSTAPEGWHFCDGSSHGTGDYPDLFDVIGHTYGGSGASFHVPNLHGRVPVGKNTGTFSTLGHTGGHETHTLTTAELPSHNHGVTDPGHDHRYYDRIRGTESAFGSGAAHRGSEDEDGGHHDTESRTTGITINHTGSNHAHNNLQPYIVLNYIIKY